jgi:hypothetical protein
MAAASADEARVCRFLLIIPAHPPATTAQPRPTCWTTIAFLRAKNALATKNWFARSPRTGRCRRSSALADYRKGTSCNRTEKPDQEINRCKFRSRRECVDHIVVLGEAHLLRVLMRYAAYYNAQRTHRSLDKDAPIHRAIQHVGRIASVPVLNGLHHHLSYLIFGTDKGQIYARKLKPLVSSRGAFD